MTKDQSGRNVSAGAKEKRACQACGTRLGRLTNPRLACRTPMPPRARPYLTVTALFLFFCLTGYAAGRWPGRLGDLNLGWKTAQFFFSYQDLGFVKRGAVGTLIHPFASLQSLAGLYAVAWLMVITLTAVFAARVSILWQRQSTADVRLLIASIATSPALFLRHGFDLGRFDVLGIALCLLSLRAIADHRVLFAAFLNAVAVLNHEAYAVIHLPVVAAFALTKLPTRNVATAVKLLGLPLLTFAAVTAFGSYEPGLAALTRQFSGNSALLRAANGQVDPDAFAVLTRTVPENVAYAARMFVEKRAVIHLPVILAWAALMVTFSMRFLRANDARPGRLFAACFTPLLLSAVACDYYRWVALTATNLFIVLLLVAEERIEAGLPVVVPRGRLTWVLFATALLGPISNTKSFPFAFSLLERLWPGLHW